jgi:SHS2 domain-containing protein
MWRVLDHTADVLVECSAPSWPALLAEAARCLGVLARSGPEAADGAAEGPRAAVPVTRTLAVEGADAVETWVNWWRACLRLVVVEGLLPVDARVEGSTSAARGSVACLPLDALSPLGGADLKAVTWHGAAVEGGPGGDWRGRIVLDV